MLPTTIYEFLPYLYMLLGAAFGLALDGIFAAFGLLLFACGAVIWVLRSGARRRNSQLRPNQVSRWYWATSFYEAIPFLYMTLGLVLLQVMQHPVRYVSGILFIAAGLVVMSLRIRERSQSTAHRMTSRASGKSERSEVSTESSQVVEAGAVAGLDLTTQDAPSDTAIPVAGDEAPVAFSGECESCVTRDICAETDLKEECVRELMRLFQTISPDYAYEMFHDAVERIEGRRLSEAELRPIIRRLESHSEHCRSWRKSGRHAA